MRHLLLLLLCVGPSVAGAASGGAYVLRGPVIARGGGLATGGAYEVFGTLGQAAVGSASGGAYALRGGVRAAGSIPPGCGDGEVGAGEQCDAGVANGTSGSCCSGTCRFAGAGTVCRPPAGPCDLPEVCSGTSEGCPAVDQKSTGLCDQATSNCLRDAFCDGTGDACPANGFNDGDLCSDTDACTVEDTCQQGACQPGPAVCAVEVPPEYQVRLKDKGKSKKLPALQIVCFSQSRGTCDADVALDAGGAGLSVDATGAGDAATVITRRLRRPKRIGAGKRKVLKLRLTRAGAARLQTIAPDAPVRVVVRARITNERGAFSVAREALLRRLLAGR